MSRFLQSKGFWKDVKNQGEYLRNLAKDLGVDDTRLLSWYARVKLHILKKLPKD